MAQLTHSGRGSGLAWIAAIIAVIALSALLLFYPGGLAPHQDLRLDVPGRDARLPSMPNPEPMPLPQPRPLGQP